MVGPSASKRSLSHIFMSIFDTGSNGRGFGKGKDICKEEGNGKKKEVVGDGKEKELEGRTSRRKVRWRKRSSARSSSFSNSPRSSTRRRCWT